MPAPGALIGELRVNREQKAAVIDEVAAEIEGAEAIYAVDYRGLSVPQAAELRAKLREADATFRVVKNRLTLRAADKAGAEGLKEMLQGPTALTFVRGDAALAAKAITRFQREHEVLELKGGLMNGEVLTVDAIKDIARLPGREQLNAQLVGVVASPLNMLVRGLGSLLSGLAIQLGQIRDQGLVGGDAPASGEAPAAEAEGAEAPAAEEAEGAAEAQADAPAEEQADAPAEGQAEETAAAEGEEAPAEADAAENEESEATPSEGDEKEG